MRPCARVLSLACFVLALGADRPADPPPQRLGRGSAEARRVTPQAKAEKPRVQDLLQRVATYIDRYHREFEAVIGEERYVQEVQVPGRRTGAPPVWAARARRVLTSELVLVWLAGDRDWIGFRDVVTVDDQRVPDAGRHKERLLATGATDRPGVLRVLAAESARHNLGPVTRNFNDPLLPHLFFSARHQSRFTFDLKGPAPTKVARAWRIEYEERERPTFIRVVAFSAPSRGEVWIDEESGALIRSEHEVGDRAADLHARTTIEYRFEPRLGLWVPYEMSELYTHPRHPWSQRIVCTARYANFRRFEVDARVLPPS